MSKAIYEIVPESGEWLIRMAGNSHSEWASTKDGAIGRARQLGSRYDEWSIRVLTDKGSLETEISHQSSPPS